MRGGGGGRALAAGGEAAPGIASQRPGPPAPLWERSFAPSDVGLSLGRPCGVKGIGEALGGLGIFFFNFVIFLVYFFFYYLF